MALPVWLTAGTLRGLEGLFDTDIEVYLIRGYVGFAIGDLCVEPFPVPHDAREPAQFVFSDGARRLGVLTDAGHVTVHMQRCLTGCDALFLECNHDPELLRAGDYPERAQGTYRQPLRTSRQRIGGSAAGRVRLAADCSTWLRHT